MIGPSTPSDKFIFLNGVDIDRSDVHKCYAKYSIYILYGKIYFSFTIFIAIYYFHTINTAWQLAHTYNVTLVENFVTKLLLRYYNLNAKMFCE